jgi:hypothetical protein
MSEDEYASLSSARTMRHPASRDTDLVQSSDDIIWDVNPKPWHERVELEEFDNNSYIQLDFLEHVLAYDHHPVSPSPQIFLAGLPGESLGHFAGIDHEQYVRNVIYELFVTGNNQDLKRARRMNSTLAQLVDERGEEYIAEYIDALTSTTIDLREKVSGGLWAVAMRASENATRELDLHMGQLDGFIEVAKSSNAERFRKPHIEPVIAIESELRLFPADTVLRGLGLQTREVDSLSEEQQLDF